MSDVDTLIGYYKDLLLYQYINSTKARSTIGLLCSQAIAELIPISVRDAFDIDTATGNQLDILGEYIGITRNVYFDIERLYFVIDNATSFGSLESGMTEYLSEINSTITMNDYTASTGLLYTMLDDEFRTMLKLKIAKNNSSASLYEINLTLANLFNDEISVIDNLDMTMFLFCTDAYTKAAQIALIKDLFPRPSGVKIEGVYISSNLNIFRILGNGNDSSIGLTDYLNDNNSENIILDYTKFIGV